MRVWRAEFSSSQPPRVRLGPVTSGSLVPRPGRLLPASGLPSGLYQGDCGRDPARPQGLAPPTSPPPPPQASAGAVSALGAHGLRRRARHAGVACAPGRGTGSGWALVGACASRGGGGPHAPTPNPGVSSRECCLPPCSPTGACPAGSRVPRGREGPMLFLSLHFAEDQPQVHVHREARTLKSPRRPRHLVPDTQAVEAGGRQREGPRPLRQGGQGESGQ